jgi:hypothetical protein
LIIVRPELVRLYWLGGAAICDFSLSAAKGDTFPVGKAPADPSSIRDFGFTEIDGLVVGAFTNTDGVEAEVGFEDDFVGSSDVAFAAAGGWLAGETEDFPFPAR